MSNDNEEYYAGGGREFLVLKNDKYWEVRELNRGVCCGSLFFTRKKAEKMAREHISEAIADKTGIKPKIIEAFLKVRRDTSSEEST